MTQHNGAAPRRVHIEHIRKSTLSRCAETERRGKLLNVQMKPPGKPCLYLNPFARRASFEGRFETACAEQCKHVALFGVLRSSSKRHSAVAQPTAHSFYSAPTLNSCKTYRKHSSTAHVKTYAGPRSRTTFLTTNTEGRSCVCFA